MRYFTLMMMFAASMTLAGCSGSGSTTGTGSDDAVKQEKEEKAAKQEKEISGDSEKEALYDDKKAEEEQAIIEKNCYELGQKAHNMGDFSKAISHFTTCIQTDPGNAQAFYFRGTSRYKSGDKDGACSDWRQASSMGSSAAGQMAATYCN